MKTHNIVKIFFLFFYFFAILGHTLELTPEEENFLIIHKTIKVGVIGDMPPLEYYGAGYKHQGITADFLHQIANKIDFEIEYKTGSYEELIGMLVKNEIDMISYGIQSRSNKTHLLFTSPYLEIYNSIFIRKNNKTTNHINDVSDSVIGIKSGSTLKELLVEKFPNMKFRYMNSYEDSVKSLLDGEIEAYIGSSIIGDYVLNKFHLQDRIKKNEIPWLRVPLRFAVSKKRPVLKDLLEKAIQDISYKEHNTILKKWVENAGKYKKIPLSLTKEENKWIESHPKILIGASGEWRPLSYVEDGKIQGVTSGFLEIIAQKTGIEFVLQEFDTFSAMIEGMKNKKIDMVDAVVASKQRAKFMDFSNSYLRLDNIIAIGKNAKQIKTVNELRGKRVGTIAGYIINFYLRQDISGIKIIEYAKAEDGLRALSSGDLDAFVLDLPMFDYYTAKYKIANLIVSANTPYSFPIHFALKKDEKVLKSIINKALDSIKESERNQIYRKWISVKFAPKIDYDLIWKIIGIFFVFLVGTLYWNRKLQNEIKKRKEIEKELVVAKETAEDATKAKSIFLANMSHEIRTPMNSVIGFADLLDEKISDPVQKGYLRSIQIGGKALLGIINDILDLSKIEAGQLQIVKESVNVHNLFLEMQQFFHDKISQKNIFFDIKIEPDIPQYLIVDGVRLRQILLNLISNAIKFTDKGGINLRVQREFKDENKSALDLIFEVEDSGIGIPKESQERIFEAFMQKEKQSVKKYGGTGLGLSICKRLIDIMNGTLELKSEVGKGSTFRVTIRDVGVSSIAEQDETDVVGDIEFKPSTIMVVDDVEENRDLIQAIFQDGKIQVLPACDGQEALKLVQNEKIDLILMDLQMPVLDGYEATMRLREQYTQEELPIIALTASVMGESLKKVKDFGFNGYLRKPTYKKAIIQELVHYLPYVNTNLDEEQSGGKVMFETEEVKEKISGTLNGELYAQWNEIKDKGDVELVRKFNEEIIALLEHQDIEEMREYTQKMLICIEGFDLVEMYNLLNFYPKLVQKVQEGEVSHV